MKRLIHVLILALLTTSVMAQTSEGNNPPPGTQPPTTKKSNKKAKTPPQDGFYARKDVDSAIFVPYAEVREEDVFYARRVWQDIDLRDTINSLLKSPKSPLMDALVMAIRDGELSAYGTKDSLLFDQDNFKTLLTPDSAMLLILGFSNIEKNGVVVKKANTYPMDYSTESFQKFRIKEDWIFDTKRSVFEPRIVGLAPLRYNEDSKEWQPVVWIYYPEARELLSKKKAINANNDASTLTFDDIFIRRLFAANIIKESTVGDKKLKDLIADPKMRLYESQRIKKAIADYEQGLWQY